LKNIRLQKLNILLIWVFIFSLFNDLFELDFGFTIAIHDLIALLHLPVLLREIRRDKKLGNFLKYFLNEWKYLFFLFFLFGMIFPWEYKDEYRTFAQRAFGRSFISLISIFSNILLIVIPIFWVKYKIITLEQLLKFISQIIIITIAIAIIDFALNYQIKQLIHSDRIIQGRFTGLSGEPRSFGRVLLFGNIIMYYAKSKYKYSGLKWAYYLTFIGILLSASASTIFSLVFIVIPVNYYFGNFNKIILLPIIVSIVLFVNVSEVGDFFVQQDLIAPETLFKIEKVLDLNDEAIPKEPDFYGYSEPEIFKRFEVFDRAALNFLWNNPNYLITGTGPNLISIPASEWTDESAKAIYGEVINSVPHTYLINVLSRSGLIGVTIVFMFFFIKFNLRLKKAKLKELRNIFITAFLVNMLIYSSSFFFVLGLIYIQYTYAVNNNTDSKLG